MNGWLLFAGISVLMINYADFIYTVLSANGAGFMSGRLSNWLWQFLFWLSGKNGKHWLLQMAGALNIVLLLGIWVLLAWLGNTLIFCADPDSILHTDTGRLATVGEKFYYVGYSLSTLGYGDFYAPTHWWKLVSVIVSFSGLSVLTIGISYLVQVLSSVIVKKQLSLYIASLGSTPQDILLNSWDGESFRQLETHFTQLTPLIFSHSQHHLAYPILHHFHSPVQSESTAITLTALDEALTILLLYFPDSQHTNEVTLISLRRAITNYMLTLENDFIRPAEQPLERPKLDQLKKRGIISPDADDESIDVRWEQLSYRRRLFKSLLENDGWTWQDLNQQKVKEGMDLQDVFYAD